MNEMKCYQLGEYGWSFADKSQKYEENMNAMHTRVILLPS